MKVDAPRLAIRMNDWYRRIWYERHPLMWLLLPFSLLYQAAVAAWGFLYRVGVLPVHPVPAAVIVVDSLTVEDSGREWLVLWMADYLREQGYRPGIICRGNPRHVGDAPQQVRADSEPELMGAVPVWLAQRSRCPVAVCQRRQAAAAGLVEHADCDIILSEGGLLEFALGRDIEIIVIDGQRRFGNGLCLPAGPLQAGAGRLQQAHIVVSSGRIRRGEHVMEYQPGALQLLSGASSGQLQSLDDWYGRSVHAVTSLSNPRSFYALLRKNGISFMAHEFSRDHRYSAEDLAFGDDKPIVMTGPDAMQCRPLNLDNAWYLPLDIVLPMTFEYRLNHLLKAIADG